MASQLPDHVSTNEGTYNTDDNVPVTPNGTNEVNDILVVWIVTNATDATFTTPAGWNFLDSNNDGTSSTHSAWKRVGPNDDNSAVTFAFDIGTSYTWMCVRIRGCRIDGSPFNQTNISTGATDASGIITTGSVTAGVQNCLHLSFVGQEATGGSSWSTSTTGYTERGTDPEIAGVHASCATKADTGTPDAESVTWDSTDNSAINTGWFMAALAPSLTPDILHARIYEDDADPTTATAKHAEDVNGTVSSTGQVQLRLLLDAITGINPASKQYTLKYEKDGEDDWEAVL